MINRFPFLFSFVYPFSRSIRKRNVSGSGCPVRVWTPESAPVPSVTVCDAWRRPRQQLARPVRVLVRGGCGCIGWLPKQQLSTATARLLLVPVLPPDFAAVPSGRGQYSILGCESQCTPRLRGPVPAPATSVLLASWPDDTLFPILSQFWAKAQRQHVVFQVQQVSVYVVIIKYRNLLPDSPCIAIPSPHAVSCMSHISFYS